LNKLVEDVPEKLKQVMRAFPQGVTLVTTKVAGRPFGVTVSAFSTISLRPPLVMLSITKGTRAHEALTKAETFAINTLGSDQLAVSERFAGRQRAHTSDFGELPVKEGSNGSLLLRTALAHVECARSALHDAGDHTIIVGRVTKVELIREALPLIYYDRRYTTVTTPSTSSPTFDSLLAEW